MPDLDGPVVRLPAHLRRAAWTAQLTPLSRDDLERLSALSPAILPTELANAIDGAHLATHRRPCTVPPREVTQVSCVLHGPPRWLLEQDVPRPKRVRSVPARSPRLPRDPRAAHRLLVDTLT